MNKKYEWVFFDLDGTLADSISVLYDVYLDFLSKFNIIGAKEEFDELNGPSLSEIVSTLKQRYNLIDNKNSLFNIYKNKIAAAYKTYVKPVDGARDILQELMTFGYKIMLVTSLDKDIAIGFIRSQRLEKYFQNYVFGNEVIKAKPSSEIYELALKKANATSDSVVIIEDSYNGIKSAKATGAFVIGLANNQIKEDLSMVCVDITVSSLKEILSILKV